MSLNWNTSRAVAVSVNYIEALVSKEVVLDNLHGVKLFDVCGSGITIRFELCNLPLECIQVSFVDTLLEVFELFGQLFYLLDKACIFVT